MIRAKKYFRLWPVCLGLLLLMACGKKSPPPAANPSPADAQPAVSQPAPPAPAKTLLEARQGFTTKLIRQEKENRPVAAPPSTLLRVVKYPSPIGEMAAYVSVAPKDGKKRPAIIWIAGGFDNSIDQTSWATLPPSNDQSAVQYRKAGIVMMYPSLRGGNLNPGFKEGCFGEVDDVLAAADFLAKQDYVDPQRIYLGGHSTGGTMALLLAESTDRFRAVFSFGPVINVAGYGQDNVPFNIKDRQETALRAPVLWLAAIRNPTYVFEGTSRGNIESLKELQRVSKNPLIHFHPLQGADHFKGLAPINKLIATKILADTGPTPNFSFTPEELAAALK